MWGCRCWGSNQSNSSAYCRIIGRSYLCLDTHYTNITTLIKGFSKSQQLLHHLRQVTKPRCQFYLLVMLLIILAMRNIDFDLKKKETDWNINSSEQKYEMVRQELWNIYPNNPWLLTNKPGFKIERQISLLFCWLREVSNDKNGEKNNRRHLESAQRWCLRPVICYRVLPSCNLGLPLVPTVLDSRVLAP